MIFRFGQSFFSDPFPQHACPRRPQRPLLASASIASFQVISPSDGLVHAPPEVHVLGPPQHENFSWHSLPASAGQIAAASPMVTPGQTFDLRPQSLELGGSFDVRKEDLRTWWS